MNEYLNADGFKRWVKKNSDFKETINKNIIGLIAETRLSPKRIAKLIIEEEGNIHKSIREFVDNGGLIKEIDEEEYLIETTSGSFRINRKYIIF